MMQNKNNKKGDVKKKIIDIKKPAAAIQWLYLYNFVIKFVETNIKKWMLKLFYFLLWSCILNGRKVLEKHNTLNSI